MNSHPRYVHDCEACIYMGQWHEYDVYFHRFTPDDGGIVIRWGSAAEDMSRRTAAEISSDLIREMAGQAAPDYSRRSMAFRLGVNTASIQGLFQRKEG